MAKEEITITDIAILNELDKKCVEMEAILPRTQVIKLKATVATLKVENEQDNQDAATLGATVASWTAKVEEFWEPWREWYFRRYKAVMTVTQNGMKEDSRHLTGTLELAEVRKQIEFLMRGYKIRRDKDKAARQASLDRMVESSKEEIDSQVRKLMLEGDMGAARTLRAQSANLQPVQIMHQEQKLDGAGMREPYKWTVETGEGGEEGLMKIIRAIAAGDVPLYHNITVKGKPERRALLELSQVVLNHKVRELGPELHIPGIAVEKDIKFSYSKTGTQ